MYPFFGELPLSVFCIETFRILHHLDPLPIPRLLQAVPRDHVKLPHSVLKSPIRDEMRRYGVRFPTSSTVIGMQILYSRVNTMIEELEHLRRFFCWIDGWVKQMTRTTVRETRARADNNQYCQLFLGIMYVIY